MNADDASIPADAAPMGEAWPMAEGTRAFEIEQDVMFQHCDPAGIVFYPRYFEMINATVERWCADSLGWPFAAMHGEDGVAIPLASIQVDFEAVSRLGERLRWRLEVARVGRSSMDLRITASCGPERRLICAAAIVQVDLETKRPTPWSERVRDRLRGEG